MTVQALSLAEVADGGLFTDGDWVESKDQDPSGGVRLTQLADIGVGEFRDRSDRWLREDQAARLRCTFLQPRDVLIARMPDPIGRACLAPADIGRAVTAVDVAVLRINRPDVLPKYAMWAINSPPFRSRVESLQSGTTRKRISRKNLATLTIPVPSSREQRQIVDILEDHLSRLAAARSLVEICLSRLEALRRAALDEVFIRCASVDGVAEYTADLRQRRSALAPGPHPKTPVPADTALVEDSSFTFCSLEELTDPRRTIRYGILKPASEQGSVPYLEVASLKGGVIDASRLKCTSTELDRQYAAARVSPGDVVVAVRGSYERSAVVPDNLPMANLSRDVVRLAPLAGVRSEFLHYWHQSSWARRYLKAHARGVAVQGVNVGTLRSMPVPAFPTEQQDLAINEIRWVNEGIDRIATSAVRALQANRGLEQALLTTAFSGRFSWQHTGTEASEEPYPHRTHRREP